MRNLIVTTKFKKSLKKVSKYKTFKQEVFDEIVMMLRLDIIIPEKYKDHSLSGDLKNIRDLHLAPDIVLLYSKDKDKLFLYLVNIGSHSELFK